MLRNVPCSEFYRRPFSKGNLKKTIFSWSVKQYILLHWNAVIKERDIFMCSALVSANGLKNEIHSCVMRLFRLMD